MAARRAVGSVQLDDPFALVAEMADQAGAVAAGALDGPGPQPAVAIGEVDQGGVAVGVGVDGRLVELGAGACGDDSGATGGRSVILTIKWGHLPRFDPAEISAWIDENRCRLEPRPR